MCIAWFAKIETILSNDSDSLHAHDDVRSLSTNRHGVIILLFFPSHGRSSLLARMDLSLLRSTSPSASASGCACWLRTLIGAAVSVAVAGRVVRALDD